ncbi:ankyrin repeat domain-containing protein [Rickettsia canadensis]|uniref:Ankyrin repeat protein n=1 Tax=Rickettsia canadensis str. CA410 TaxID=1105107 RepID=A0ABN4A8J8_RICCA|nr:ankyrin repeat domain-containing protein [Rickettsia canadensis]AFB20901.1 hypothetical protein RCA_01620 [Rickettsia canadensis str. CA410]
MGVKTLNVVDKKRGNDALYLVILDSSENDTELITCLIKNGININHQNSLGNTALLTSGYLSVVRILLENGADINIKNNENITSAILLQNEMFRYTIFLLIDLLL